MKKKIISWLGGVAVVLTSMTAFYAPQAGAHGERSQEPFLRMRTVHWFDTNFSTNRIGVNEEMTITGKFLLAEAWPEVIQKPDVAFLHGAEPGPAVAKVETYLNGVPAAKSFKLELGKTYEYKIVVRGRKPGEAHIHPMLNVQSAGGLVGPGQWTLIEGNYADFTFPVTTLTGEAIDLNTVGFANVVKWHIIWAIPAVFWLLWWVRRPLFIPRFLMVRNGEEDALITGADKKVAIALLLGTLVLIMMSSNSAKSKYPVQIPLQSAIVPVEPLPVTPVNSAVKVKIVKANYRIPGRSMTMTIDVTNGASTPIQLAEFNSANVRFTEASLITDLPDGDSKEFWANGGLTVKGNPTIYPGETARLEVEAGDALWETERLSSLIGDPDSAFGGVLYFKGADGKMYFEEIAGPIIPTFQ
uniref:Methane monooxygenase protein B2 n=1 Tax=Methylococcaceae bacterium ET-SHO TaxID=557142 RepID=B9X092_9GAMM|nr:methane monooxygenase protein B2 [Methylococcaceae bacterium ET-SHO]